MYNSIQLLYQRFIKTFHFIGMPNLIPHLFQYVRLSKLINLNLIKMKNHESIYESKPPLFYKILMGGILLLLVNFQSMGQCTLVTLGGNINATTVNNSGNSFQACQTGFLLDVSVVSVSDVTNKTMIIYEGDGTDGRILTTITGINLHTATTTNDCMFRT